MRSDQHIAEDLEVTVLLVFHLCDALKSALLTAKSLNDDKPMGTDAHECGDH